MLESIDFIATDETDFDTYLQNETKSFLLGKQSFLETGSGTSDVAYALNEIKQAYLYLAMLLLPKYKEIKVLEEIKRTSTTLLEKGAEKQKSTYFEPVVNGAQNEISNTGLNADAFEDTTTFTESVKGESEKLVEFYDLTKNNVEKVMIDFVNVMV